MGGSWNIFGSEGGISLKSKAGTSKVAKWSCVKCDCVPATTDEMILWLDASSKFPLVPNVSSDPRLEQVLGTANVRDYAVATIRGFISAYSK
jgi:hypothetical protein